MRATPSPIAVVDLPEHHRAVALVTVDHPHLPQRPALVERGGEEAAHQLGQRVFAPRGRQLHPLHVAVEIELIVVHPAHLAVPPQDPLVKPGDRDQATPDDVLEPLEIEVPIEREHPVDLHQIRPVPHPQPGTVDGGKRGRCGAHCGEEAAVYLRNSVTVTEFPPNFGGPG